MRINFYNCVFDLGIIMFRTEYNQVYVTDDESGISKTFYYTLEIDSISEIIISIFIQGKFFKTCIVRTGHYVNDGNTTNLETEIKNKIIQHCKIYLQNINKHNSINDTIASNFKMSKPNWFNNPKIIEFVLLISIFIVMPSILIFF